MREPISRDFVRLSAYAARVMDIGYFLGYYPIFWDTRREVPTEVWNILFRHAPRPLLPNLGLLSYEESPTPYANEELVPGVDPFHPAELLFGPNLQKVEFTGLWIHPHRPTEVIKKLCSATPNLKSLLLGAAKGYPSEFTSLSCPELSASIHLVEFDGSNIKVGPDTLAAIGSLPNLQEVYLHIDSADYTWDVMPHGRRATFFPALTKLCLTGTAFEWCAAFLHAVAAVSLKELYIGVSDPRHVAPDGILFEALCTAIGSLPCGESLHCIEIDTPCTAGAPLPAFRPRHIVPLTGLKGGLRRLRLKGACQITVDDPTLESMARAWPDIHEITIPWLEHPAHSADDHVPRATLAGLASLLQHCPQLITLTLSFDMRSIPALDLLRPYPVVRRDSALKRLSAEGSILCDALGLSAFLVVVCPRLQKIAPDHSSWRDVKWCFSLFLQIREQERKWALERRGSLQSEVASE